MCRFPWRSIWSSTSRTLLTLCQMASDVSLSTTFLINHNFPPHKKSTSLTSSQTAASGDIWVVSTYASSVIYLIFNFVPADDVNSLNLHQIAVVLNVLSSAKISICNKAISCILLFHFCGGLHVKLKLNALMESRLNHETMQVYVHLGTLKYRVWQEQRISVMTISSIIWNIRYLPDGVENAFSWSVKLTKRC